MCDYSLKHLASRPAAVDDKLNVSKFPSTMSLGFTGGDRQEVVCVLPGTELAFSEDIVETKNSYAPFFAKDIVHPHKTARFRQVDLENQYSHHDALEMPDGTIVKLQNLKPNQTATVLQLPAAPKNEQEAKEQERLEVVA